MGSCSQKSQTEALVVEQGENHRVALIGRDLKDHLAPNLHHGRHLSLDQVVQGLIFERFQGGNIRSLSEQPVPMPNHLHCKEFLPYI